MTISLSGISRLALVGAALTLASCAQQSNSAYRGSVAIPSALLNDMKSKGMDRNSPILVRIYKQESELELWKKTSSGSYALLKTYPICRWSGQLGPKKSEGDRQVPEGFYAISARSLNPRSQYYLSFDVGYPNAYDRQFGRAGGNIMVHGACSSRGCYAMTDKEMGEIYAVARDALAAGQSNFQLQSYPFRMTAENFAKHRRNPNIAFWRNLKEGADTFEVTKQPVQVAACSGKYAFGAAGGCGLPANPSIAGAVASREARDNSRIASLTASTPAVSVIYEDGGSHPSFAHVAASERNEPGKDRPMRTISPPTVIALNDAGAPASDGDASAARRASYSAAERLMMSEAAVARRPYGVQPGAVAKRQATFYSGVVGGSLPSEPVKPTPKPAPVAVAAAESEGDGSSPFYARILGFAETPAAAAPRPADAPVAPARKPVRGTKQMAQSLPQLDMTGSSEREEKTPFYKKWFGLGGGDAAAPSALSEGDVPQGTVSTRRAGRTDDYNAYYNKAQ